MADDEGVSHRAPEEAFGLFSHELRVEILFALWAADGHALPYAQLQDRVGERDSGKFNYHLSQVTGQFVGKEGDDYTLRYPGHRVIDAIRSGVLHREAEVDSVSLDAACPDCGASLTFTYEDYLGRVGCLDCASIVLSFPFDPGGIQDRSPPAVAAAFDRRTRLFWRFALAGVCPVCAGVVETRLASGAGSELDSHYADDHPAVLAVDCAGCSFYNYPPVGIAVLAHPAVAGWLYDHGVDPRTTPAWAFDCVVDPDRITVRGTDPWTVTVTLSAGGERLAVDLDERAAVTSLERRPADTDARL
ncbi:hypothetical protein ACFQL1_10175 [Halomicroarcula sp. GCM10025709]|uniref:DUF7351 domain-containing protein n=1 Tax=Haloarcula TaxID=2237 RepID=UPI0024C37458|nr:hypothetical protein [Halomicroarcula sp. YJ-61-S]